MKLLLVLCLLLCLFGCDSTPKPTFTGERINDVQAGIVERTYSIEQQTIQIDKETQGAVEPHTESIRQSASEIEALAVSLDEAEEAASIQAEQIESLKAELESERDRNTRWLRFTLNTLGVSCLVAVGVLCVLGFILKSKTMFAIAAGSAVVGGLAFGVSVYLKTVALISIIGMGVVILGVAGYFIYELMKERKSLKEVVKTAETAKEHMSQKAKELVYGTGIADEVQSNRTKAVVRRLRKQK